MLLTVQGILILAIKGFTAGKKKVGMEEFLKEAISQSCDVFLEVAKVGIENIRLTASLGLGTKFGYLSHQ